VNSKHMKILFISMMAGFLIAGCASMGGATSGVDELSSGNHSNIKDPMSLDIHNQADFDALWQKAFANLSGAPDKPMVDFSKSMVVAVFAGGEPTGGYAIRVSNVDNTGDSMNVTAVITQPGQDCLRSDFSRRASEPYLFAMLPASTKPVNITTQLRNAPSCGGN
jgi:PrcB C-terminal